MSESYNEEQLKQYELESAQTQSFILSDAGLIKDPEIRKDTLGKDDICEMKIKIREDMVGQTIYFTLEEPQEDGSPSFRVIIK